MQITQTQLDSLPFDFHKAVEDLREKLLAHRFMTDQPKPTGEHDLVEAAVRRVPVEGGPDNFVIDYEVINDKPKEPAADEGEDRKITRFLKQQDIRKAEAAALEELIPAGKHRLHAMDLQRAMQAPPKERNKAERDIIARDAELAPRRAEIEYAAARAEAELADVPDDKVAEWQVPPIGSAK